MSTWKRTAGSRVRQLDRPVFNGREKSVIVDYRDFFHPVFELLGEDRLLCCEISHVNLVISCSGNDLAVVFEESSGEYIPCMWSFDWAQWSYNITNRDRLFFLLRSKFEIYFKFVSLVWILNSYSKFREGSCLKGLPASCGRQILMNWSSEPETSRLPSLFHSRQLTHPVWPSRIVVMPSLIMKSSFQDGSARARLRPFRRSRMKFWIELVIFSHLCQ